MGLAYYADLSALSGTLLNALTVLVGGLFGTVLGDRLPERLRENVVRGVGLFTLAMGTKFAIDTTNLLYILGSILLGGIVGSLWGVDRRLNDLGAALQRRFATRGGDGTVSEAFVTASIVFCVGPVILLYQGGLALGASAFSDLLSDLQLREMSAVGGLLIIGVGLKLLSIRDVKVADYLPAILVAPLLVAAVVRIKEALAL